MPCPPLSISKLITQKAAALHCPSQNSKAKSSTHISISLASLFIFMHHLHLFYASRTKIHIFISLASLFIFVHHLHLFCTTHISISYAQAKQNQHLHLFGFSFSFYASCNEDLVRLLVKWVKENRDFWGFALPYLQDLNNKILAKPNRKKTHIW